MEQFYYSSDMAIRRRRREDALKTFAVIVIVAIAMIGASVEDTSAIQISNQTSATATMAQMGITQ